MCPPPGDIPNLGFEPRSPALHADSLLYGEAQEYWSGQPVHSSGELSNPGTELGSPALQADSLPAEL